MCWFLKRGENQRTQRKDFSEQGREATTNSTQLSLLLYCYLRGCITRKELSSGALSCLISRFWPFSFQPRGQTCLEFYTIVYMYLSYVTSCTTHIHEATSQKETDISNWLADGKTAIDRLITGAGVIFFYVEKRLGKFDIHFTISERRVCLTSSKRRSFSSLLSGKQKWISTYISNWL